MIDSAVFRVLIIRTLHILETTSEHHYKLQQQATRKILKYYDDYSRNTNLHFVHQSWNYTVRGAATHIHHQ
jgi:hypothetical protein